MFLCEVKKQEIAGSDHTFFDINFKNIIFKHIVVSKLTQYNVVSYLTQDYIVLYLIHEWRRA